MTTGAAKTVVSLTDRKTWTTTTIASSGSEAAKKGKTDASAKPAYRPPAWLQPTNPKNPNFTPRQSWPEEKYIIKKPKQALGGEVKHRFELFKKKDGTDFGGASTSGGAGKGKQTTKGGAGGKAGKRKPVAAAVSNEASGKRSKKASSESLTLEERLSRPLSS